jgi:hypothetical protein
MASGHVHQPAADPALGETVVDLGRVLEGVSERPQRYSDIGRTIPA